MIVGEIPGRDEDRIGIPFAGVAGQLLDRMLTSFGRDRSSSYLVNLLPWRPPGNRTPTDEELALLMPWLYRHIQLAKPSVILLLGGMPCRIVLVEGRHFEMPRPLAKISILVMVYADQLSLKAYIPRICYGRRAKAAGVC